MFIDPIEICNWCKAKKLSQAEVIEEMGLFSSYIMNRYRLGYLSHNEACLLLQQALDVIKIYTK